MPNTPVTLLKALRRYLCKACTEEELRVFLFETLDGYDYLQYADGREYATRAFTVLVHLEKTVGTTAITKIAQESLQAYGDRPEVQDLRNDLAAFFPPDSSAGSRARVAAGPADSPPDPAPHLPPDPSAGSPARVAAGPADSPPDPAPRLPPDLVRVLMHYLPVAETIGGLAAEMRSQFRNKVPPVLDPPFRFHLSAQERERLTAVLALERVPDPAYLWWLAERVTIEPPAIGFLAAKALTAAALRLPRANLSRLRSAAETAVDRLVDMMQSAAPQDARPADEADPPGDEDQAEFDPAARKKEVDTAIALVDMRSMLRKRLLSPDDLERFLLEMIAVFQRDALERLGKALDFPLRLWARTDDPIEHCVIYLAIRAREGLWERELIEASLAAQPANLTFKSIQQKYTAAKVGVPLTGG